MNTNSTLRIARTAVLALTFTASAAVADFIPQRPCDTAVSTGVTYRNIRIHPSKNDQVETHIDAREHGTHTTLAAGAITYRRAYCANSTASELGYYFSVDSFPAWSGFDTLPFTNTQADPVLAVGRGDTAYYAYIKTGLQLEFGRTSDYGANWSGPYGVSTQNSEDKPYFVVGQSPTAPDSQYMHAVFSASRPSTGNYMYYARSRDFGTTWDTLSLSGSAGATGGTVAVGDSGKVYVAWAQSIGGSVYGIKFRKSQDAGGQFLNEVTVNNANPRMLYHSLKSWFVRGRGFPSIGVDTSHGEFHGTVYVSWAGINDFPGTYDTTSYTPLDPDVFLAKSTNDGQSFAPTSGIRVNQDTLGNGLDQWMPAMEIDPYGGINIVYYDSRIDENNEFTEVYLARSIDGGVTFRDVPISTVAFKPCNAKGLPTGYGIECDVGC